MPSSQSCFAAWGPAYPFRRRRDIQKVAAHPRCARERLIEIPTHAQRERMRPDVLQHAVQLLPARQPEPRDEVEAIAAAVDLQRRRHPDRADVVELLEV